MPLTETTLSIAPRIDGYGMKPSGSAASYKSYVRPKIELPQYGGELTYFEQLDGSFLKNVKKGLFSEPVFTLLNTNFGFVLELVWESGQVFGYDSGGNRLEGEKRKGPLWQNIEDVPEHVRSIVKVGDSRTFGINTGGLDRPAAELRMQYVVNVEGSVKDTLFKELVDAIKKEIPLEEINRDSSGAYLYGLALDPTKPSQMEGFREGITAWVNEERFASSQGEVIAPKKLTGDKLLNLALSMAGKEMPLEERFKAHNHWPDQAVEYIPPSRPQRGAEPATDMPAPIQVAPSPGIRLESAKFDQVEEDFFLVSGASLEEVQRLFANAGELTKEANRDMIAPFGERIAIFKPYRNTERSDEEWASKVEAILADAGAVNAQAPDAPKLETETGEAIGRKLIEDGAPAPGTLDVDITVPVAAEPPPASEPSSSVAAGSRDGEDEDMPQGDFALDFLTEEDPSISDSGTQPPSQAEAPAVPSFTAPEEMQIWTQDVPPAAEAPKPHVLAGVTISDTTARIGPEDASGRKTEVPVLIIPIGGMSGESVEGIKAALKDLAPKGRADLPLGMAYTTMRQSHTGEEVIVIRPPKEIRDGGGKEKYDECIQGIRAKLGAIAEIKVYEKKDDKAFINKRQENTEEVKIVLKEVVRKLAKNPDDVNLMQTVDAAARDPGLAEYRIVREVGKEPGKSPRDILASKWTDLIKAQHSQKNDGKSL